MSFPYPTLDFGLGETAEMLRDSVYEFASAEIAPRAAEIDESNEAPLDLWPTRHMWRLCAAPIQRISRSGTTIQRHLLIPGDGSWFRPRTHCPSISPL